MIDTIPNPDASLSEFLAARARHASDTRLVSDALGGLAIALLAGYWHGWGWHLILSAAICFAMFGLWGITDRELAERATSASRPSLLLLKGSRVIAAVVGYLSAAFLTIAALGVAIGLVKS